MEDATNTSPVQLGTSATLEARLAAIELQLQRISERNARVELEKAWETSTARKISIVSITYLSMTLVMIALDAPRPLLNAIIPTLGYFLSTPYLGYIKQGWMERR